jgi:hypothetical protein
MDAPIVEEQIPMADCKGGRAEPRVIYQQSSDGVLRRTAAYCKFSENQIAANVALGGKGISIDEALEAILRPLLPTNDLARAVTTMKEQLFETCDRFAEGWQRESSSRSREFALDIGLVWDSDAQCLDFYLIEVQRGFAFSGLYEVDKEAGLIVEKNRFDIQQELNNPALVVKTRAAQFVQGLFARINQTLNTQDLAWENDRSGEEEG